MKKKELSCKENKNIKKDEPVAEIEVICICFTEEMDFAKYLINSKGIFGVIPKRNIVEQR